MNKPFKIKFIRTSQTTRSILAEGGQGEYIVEMPKYSCAVFNDRDEKINSLLHENAVLKLRLKVIDDILNMGVTE